MPHFKENGSLINTPPGLHMNGLAKSMKKIAIQENNTSAWVRYKQARNEGNNAIKSEKTQYFIHSLKVNEKNPRKTWMLIDVLSSRKCRRARNISEIKVSNETVEMAEVCNDYFATIGSNLAK